MASAELRLGPYNITDPTESKLSSDFLQLRQAAIGAFSRNLTPRGVLATSDGRFRAIYIRDAATGEYQAMQKEQNGTLEILTEGARRTLITGAEYQGTRFRWITRERRGAIIHEEHGADSDQERLAEIAKAKGGKWVSRVDGHYEGKNYRSLDSTLWWLCLYDYYVKKTHDYELMEQLWPNFESALNWLDRYGRKLIKGGFEGGRPPRNLGWKDSESALIDESGNFPSYPVASLDVNSVAYLADRGAADLYDLKGDQKMAGKLRTRADERRELIDKLFWLDEYSVYAPAVDVFDRPIRIRTSDSVYALAAGITSDRSSQIVRSMLETDLFIVGRGLRTRSTRSKQFSTSEYQNGNIWYHLAPMAGAACEKFGLTREAQAFDSCIPTIVQEEFPELVCADRDNNILTYTERDPHTGEEKAVGCKNFTMTIGGVLNRLAA